MNKTKYAEYDFPSRSTPGITYKVTQWTDGLLSCNCPGWTRRVGKDGLRKCRHVESLREGRGDWNAKVTFSAGNISQGIVKLKSLATATMSAQPYFPKPKPEPKPDTMLNSRRFRFEKEEGNG